MKCTFVIREDVSPEDVVLGHRGVSVDEMLDSCNYTDCCENFKSAV